MKANELRRGHVIEHDNRVWQVREIDRSVPTARGGNTTYRVTLYSIPGAQKLDLSLRADDELREVALSRRQASYSYRDDLGLVFMDDEDYSQYLLGADLLGDAVHYISDGLSGCHVQLIDGQPVGLQLPATVELEVVETAPEIKGGTATRRPKPARLDTGLEVMVPEYIGNGERILVNTLSGEYAGRP